MDTDLVLLWLVVASCLLNAKPAIQVARAGRPSFLYVFVAVLLVAGLGVLFDNPWTGRLSASLFALFVLLPGVLQRRLWQLTGAQRYDAALPYARAIAVLHPASGFWQMPALLRALSLAQRGDSKEAERRLELLASGPSNPTRSDAITHLCRLRGDWSGYLERSADRPLAALRFDRSALVGRLRALGETGQLNELLALYEAHADQLLAAAAPFMRAYAQLFLFAFTGRVEATERVLRGALAQQPSGLTEYWRATCAFAAGDEARARALLEPLRTAAAGEIASGARRRLEAPPRVASEVLSPENQRKLEALEREEAQDVRYGTHAPLQRARVTRLFLSLCLCAFVAEELLGGSEDGPTLYRLGAAVAGQLLLSEAYRLLTALFLHFGVLHLALNMLNLALIGPFVESSLGRLRTACVYLTSGLAGSLLVSLIPQETPGLFLGASGCIMGLLGATVGILLHGHRRDRSRIARQRLQRLALPLLLQLGFDLTVPGVSLTAHWTGVFVGLVLGWTLSRASAS